MAVTFRGPISSAIVNSHLISLAFAYVEIDIVINGGTFEDSTLSGDKFFVDGAQFITVNGPKIVYSYFSGKKNFIQFRVSLYSLVYF